ncbi:MAG: ABC transporter permease [Oscillospiraceae bacterium]
MRLRALICGEARLLYKYGIIQLYCIFTAIYLCLLAAIPSSAKEATAAVLVFTDPAAMGLFFMGAMVLFEKSQRIESSLAVAPIKISEYIFGKVLPLMVVGIMVGAVLCFFAGIKNTVLALLGVALSSVLFSLCGLMVGSNIKTLSGFMIATVPFEIFICVPALLFLFGVLKSELWLLHPGVPAIRLICGDTNHWYLSAMSLMLWIVPAYLLCKKAVVRSFCAMGGVKL